MRRIEEPNVVILHTANLRYLRVDISGVVQLDVLGPQLDNPKLWALAAETGRSSALLNFMSMPRFGTGELEWLGDAWARSAAAAGVRRVSVVLQEQAMRFFAGFLAPATQKAATHGVELRFFPHSQFYESFESVEWLA